MSNHEGARDPDDGPSTLDGEALLLTQNAIRPSCDDTTAQRLQRKLGSIATRLQFIEQSVNRHNEKAKINVLGDRINVLQASTNNSLPSIHVVLERVQKFLDGLQPLATARQPGP